MVILTFVRPPAGARTTIWNDSASPRAAHSSICVSVRTGVLRRIISRLGATQSGNAPGGGRGGVSTFGASPNDSHAAPSQFVVGDAWGPHPAIARHVHAIVDLCMSVPPPGDAIVTTRGVNRVTRLVTWS